MNKRLKVIIFLLMICMMPFSNVKALENTNTYIKVVIYKEIYNNFL